MAGFSRFAAVDNRPTELSALYLCGQTSRVLNGLSIYEGECHWALVHVGATYV